MNVLSFDYDLDYGFAWIMVADKDKQQLTVQCCLKSDEPGIFQKIINKMDCGHNWGLCADANEKAFETFGEEECMNALFEQAKLNGIEVVA